MSSPASASWPCRLTSAALTVAQQGEQLVVAEPVEGGHGGEVGVDAIDEVGGQVGQRAAQAADAPRRPEAAGRRPRIEPAQHAADAARRRRARPRSAAATPSTAITSGLRRSAPAGDVPVSASASRRPSRSGSSQRSCSSVDSASGNDSATGPGPNTVPDVGGSVVIGRACRRCSSPSPSTAHSTSCGPPYVRSARRASRASWRRIGDGRPRRRRPERTSRTRPRRSSTPVQPSTSPDTSRSGPPATAATTMRSRRPDTGIGAEQHAAPRGLQHRLDEDRHVGVDEAGEAGPVGRAQHRRRAPTSSSASPSTSRIESKTPAIDDASPSSPVDDERTTTGTRALGGRRHATRRRRHRGRAATSAVVSTTPGSAGRPAVAGAGEVRRLRPDEVGTTGGRVVERDDGWGRDGVHGARPSRGTLENRFRTAWICVTWTTHEIHRVRI